ncbi:FtsK/SpoIIIE domain-containing protein [Microbacterium mangrovi]|uniref:FtsK/SpoIIIE domain-containing protein n=1 Tax=Microbacterium mangrovi TaxID=1348253 RepID=UPI000691B777|nr:FtsK/SpoIIIE domain-containing protein [Microbacterium mangrovi]
MSSPSPFTPTLSGRVLGTPGSAAPDLLGAPRFGSMAEPSVDEPLRLPDAAEPPRRGPLPLLASLVPVLGSLVLWVATGSPFMLWFALLGPVIAVATRLDGRRTARRDAARRRAEAEAARSRVSARVAERHERERDRLWAGHPDVATALGAGVIWTGTAERRQSIVVGSGRRPSTVQVSGGAGDPDSAALRARAAVLEDAPVTVPAGIGIAVVGPAVVAAAVVRALAAQVLLASAPGDVRIAGDPHDESGWLQDAPHARSATGTTLVCGIAGETPVEGDIVLLRVPDGMPVPPRCGAVLALTGIDRATLTVGADAAEVGVEAISLAQAQELTAELTARAAAVFAGTDATAPATLAELVGGAGPAEPSGSDSLCAVIGTSGRTPFVLDLVVDGPHAVVVGMTGAGKSELLISWVTALCAAHGPDDVTFLLADFKGGTAFDALQQLPHVTGVITDLDGSGARRALQSLSAELRWREAQLVQAGARDIRDERVTMPRLVVIVDEFAALLAEHPELQAVFTDVAARGRALGMHLVLGTQRAAGVLRESLLANCPLRICLRVADAADSRAVIGTDAAAALPGGADGRGAALVRRAADAAPVSVRVARTDAALLTEVARRHPLAETPRRPWLPELPRQLALADVPDAPDGAVVLGLADDPENQRQVPVLLGERGLLVVGRAGSGRSTVLATIGAQVVDRLRVEIATDPEGGWDALSELASDDPWGEPSAAPGSVVLIDDLDALLGGLPPDYAQAAAEHLERFVRGAAGRGIRVAITAARVSGAVARIADAVPRRAILATGSRMDHIAAGGDAHDRLPETPGRAVLDGQMMQFAQTAPRRAAAPAAPAVWQPADAITGVVVRSGARAGLARILDERGLATCTVDEFGEHPAARAPLAVIGDPDAWLRNWRALAEVRGGHDLLIDASCAAEYRALTADRELPPYCTPGRNLAWFIRSGGAPRRVQLPRR